MCGSRHPNCAAGATVVVLLLTATLIAGCAGSTPTADVPAPQSATSAAQPKTSPEARSHTVTVHTTAVTRARTQASRHVAPAHPVPAAFRPAPGASSDAEVRRELAQVNAIHHQERQQALSAAAANLAGLLPWSLEPKSGTQVSVASVFTDYGLGLACGGVLGRNQLGVAHKTAPCGTLITFTYAGHSVTVPVIDRGPYIVGREWDLTGATAAALAFPGLGPIRWSLAR
jgi:rare lipoprotein A (peptidoglycan hydrolase)